VSNSTAQPEKDHQHTVETLGLRRHTMTGRCGRSGTFGRSVSLSNKRVVALRGMVMGHWGYVIMAYGIVWCSVLVYVTILKRRLAKAEGDLLTIRARPGVDQDEKK